jgi:hypothetical protein
MNKKRTLIVSSVIFTSIFVIIGTIVFVFLRNQNTLTEPLSKAISGKIESKIEGGFILKDSFWERATIYHQTYFDGNKGESIRFVGLPVGTKVYAPFDGYVYISDVSEESGAIDVVVLSSRDNWDWSSEPVLNGERTLMFIARELKSDETVTGDIEEFETEYNFKIKAGDVLAEIIANEEITDNANFLIESHFQYANLSITEPKEYLEKIILFNNKD